MLDSSSTIDSTDSQANLMAIAPRHLYQLAEYLRQHEDEGLTEEMVVEWALDEFFERNLQCESRRAILTTLKQYKYL